MKQKSLLKFPKNILVLSLISLLNDIAGETVRRLFPLFLVTILGVTTSIVGLIEGIGEATPHLIEPLSGYLSDKTDNRKIFVIIGQILRSSMLLLIFIVSWPQALLVRFLDRMGKGIALAPRDSLIARSTNTNEQGHSFGFNRAMDNLGATIGTGLIILILLFFGNRQFLELWFFKLLILIVVAPSLLIAFILLILKVSEKKDQIKEFVFKDHLGREFYIFLAISFIFSLGSFSDGFLVLKAQYVGISLLGIFALLGFFTLTSTLVALPACTYSDHHERRRVLAFGWLVFSASFVGFGLANNFWQLIPLFIIYGVYYGITQGVGKAIVADLVPHTRLGLAFGLYSMIQGLALLPASIIAGVLWQKYNPTVAFYFGALLALLGAFGIFYILPHPHKHWWEIWKR